MKKAIIAILIILFVVGACVGIKIAMNKSSGNTSAVGSALGVKSSSSDYTFAKPEAVVLSGFGGVQLGTVDLGDGPVPLLQIPLDTWGGYAGLFAANKGAKPNKDSYFYQNGKFAVELVREESAQKQQNGYASGKWPVIWAPMDSLPQLYDSTHTDKRVTPKGIGLFDWSYGGDGIIVRNSIKKPSDLKDKIILTSSNTPYSFLLLWYLSQIGLTGNDVKVVWIDDGDKALQTFKRDKNIVAWVSWTPYINDVVNSSSESYVPDTRLLINSKDTNQLIADMFIVRNDFLQEKPEILEVLTEGIIAGTQMVDNSTYNNIATFYKFKDASEAKAMMGDVHLANFPETKMFFDTDNAIGAYSIFYMANEYYKQLGIISSTTSYDPAAVLSTKVLEKIEKKGIFKDQKNNMIGSFNQKASHDASDLESGREILANNLKIYFDPQQVTFDINNKDDPKIVANMKIIYDIAKQAKVLATSSISLTGHLDTTKVADYKAKGDQAEFIKAAQAARSSSLKRAQFIKKILVEKYGIEEDRIFANGRGWDQPIEGGKPEDNRRVEVQFIALE